jgi:type II secretory pathway pseudopilin PulG
MKKAYHWFTIIELLAAIIIISLALLSILWLLNIAVTYTNKIRQETIAINLAREGIEWVYNRRNTNWLRQSWEKDKNRLNIDNQTLGSGNRFQWWWALYRLSYIPTPYGKITTYQRMWTISDDSILWDASLLLSTGDFIWGTSPDAAGRFYRGIIWLWLYQKDTNVLWWNPITTCPNWDDSNFYGGLDINWNPDRRECNDSYPKEYRFCSRVEYEQNLKWKVELCGSITNYQE